MSVTATGNFNGQELKEIPVLDPGDWFGKCWLIEIGGSYVPLFLVVEADTITDAIDELADNEKYGHQIVMDEADLVGYPEENIHYSGSGKVLALDHLLVHGQERSECPFPCLYHGEGLPEAGVKPTDYWRRED